jgi:RimJ/RimL family protein N-acetyltransferase
VIVLETARLILREMTEADVEPLYALLGDRETLHLWPKTYTREEVVEWVRRSLERYRTDGYGLWAVELKASGETIGDCGLVAREVDGAAETELGYHLQRKHWGRGYATEAAAACRDHAWNRLGKEKLIALIMPHNLPSRRVAERIGMKVEGRTMRPVGGEHLIYAVRRTA